MKKTMIIGLGPEYNYPNDYKTWEESNTKYASNHGASLISRVLSKQFDGVYVDDFSNIDELNEIFDQCIVGFATHVTDWRDVSKFTNVVEKLDMPVFAFSLGLQDYSGGIKSISKLHPSMKKLLDIVSDRSKYLGVRGNYTASLLFKNGLKNVVPIGCPTVYWNLNGELKIQKPTELKNPGIVFHRTLLGDQGIHLAEGKAKIIGQDFLDEVIFSNNKGNDEVLFEMEKNQYKSQGHFDKAMSLITDKGVFQYTFDEWFKGLNKYDFIVGPRLHGCVASLIQNIPAVLLARDLRVQEIGEFYDIPHYHYKDLKKFKSINEIFESVDYTKFNKTYKLRYDNYIKLLEDNGLESNLNNTNVIDDYVFNSSDYRTNLHIGNSNMSDLNDRLSLMEKRVKEINNRHNLIMKLPFSKKIKKIIKSK
jgi:hypothetical protein